MNNTLPENDPADAEDDLLLSPENEEIVIRLSADACGSRFDKALSALLPQYSRNRLQQWMEAGLITIEGQPVKPKATVYGDETVVVRPQPDPETMSYSAEAMALPIVHEDETILVIDKPAGMVVHPAAGNWSGTLLNGLLHHSPAIAGVPRAGIVHRLDKETSGLMVVAKTLEAQTNLVRQLQARSVKREYLALVWGQTMVSGKVEAAIGRHPRDRIKMAVSDSPSAKPALTHYERLATGAIDGRQVSLLRCRLETGRTHQIRVHMQSIGFGLVGDPLYGKPHLASVFPRQALHAQRLGLLHPATNEACEWQAPLPDDFSGLLQRAGIAHGAAE
ncbi:RluA family pseudouridine synthase [Noviherbaspirillum humi]|uniref:RluA family pseudouridine synthase n=1 Tax=Noviherbaspirillum humi TaxID=1688639 RepID=UPI003CCC3D13